METPQEARGGHRFGPFLLCGPQGPLLRDDAEIRLQRKTLSLLWLLVRHAGRVVTKREILDVVWADAVVGEESLTYQIQLLRTALGDSARKPRYIETAHGIGFRFVGAPSEPAAPEPIPAGCFGRDAELRALAAFHADASRGKRQIVFVSGEAGIGKSTLVNAFAAGIPAADSSALVARGQCFEQHGVGEAYLPIVGALGQLCRDTAGAELIELLRRFAPTWLLGLPGLVEADETSDLEQRSSGATSDRKKVELAIALEELTAHRTLVLILEDLHWSDESTLDVLSVLAGRMEPARLLVIATFRPLDALMARHPVRSLKVELVGRSLARELPLGYLRREDVERMLEARFPDRAADHDLAERVHRRTEGHPLFVVQVMEHLERRGSESLGDLPQSLKDLIELHVGRLEPSAQAVLEAASIAGAEFAAAACGAALELSTDAVESICERLSRDSLYVEDRGLAIWPDGTVSGRYGFSHSLYEQVLRARVPSAKRARFARRIAERLETAYRERTEEIAAALAAHFADAALPEREIEARLLAAERARRSAAPSEARAHANRGLELLKNLPAGASRDRLEFGFVLVVAECAHALMGYGRDERWAVLDRLAQLLGAAPDSVSSYRAHYALAISCLFGGRMQRALEISLETAKMFRAENAPELECHALINAAVAQFYKGDQTEAARFLARCDELIAEIAPAPRAGHGPSAPAPTRIADPITVYHGAGCFVQWMLGHADRAAAHLKHGLEHAEAIGNSHFQASILHVASDLALLRREPRVALETAHRMLDFCKARGEEAWAGDAMKHLLIARCFLGEVREALPIFREILAAEDSMGALAFRPFDLALVAEACRTDGRLDEARAALAAGFAEVERSGNRGFEPELHRVLGECALAEGDGEAAERSFRAALDLARSQHARAFELRAALALGRLYRSQRRERLVREVLAPVYETFTEGFDAPDLREAKTLLETTKPRRKV